MTSMTAFEPRWVSSPADSIADALRRKNWSTEDLADSLQLPDPFVRRLVTGEIPVDQSIADLLAQVIGGTPRFWIEREARYRDGLRWLDADELTQRLPFDQMQSFGWIEPVGDHWHDRAEACLNFFGVSDSSEWNRRYAASVARAKFRASPTFQSDEAAVAAWLRQAEIAAQEVDTAKWNPDALEQTLGAVRDLTREAEPQRFVPQLQVLLGRAGVAPVVVRAPRGCPISGASFRSATGQLIVALSARFLTDDQLWFSLFHELGHVMLHGVEEPTFDELDGETEDPAELEANEFAAKALNPAGIAPLLEEGRRQPTMRHVIAHASRCGVAPGVIVGQLQHAGHLRPNQLNGLRRRYRWDGSSLKSARRN